jgi:hypothetical protein
VYKRQFEDRVQRALIQLGVPTREDLNSLIKRVESLTTELKKHNKAPVVKKLPAKTKQVPHKVAKKAGKISLPKAPTPVSPKA